MSQTKTKEVRDTEAIDVQPPVAEKVTYEMEIHGDKRNDPYYWMRLSDDQKENETPDQQTQKVVAYLEAENAYCRAMLKPTEGFQDKLFKEIVGRIKEDDVSVPHLDNGYYYYDRYEKGKEYEILCRSKTINGKEELLLDVNQLAEGHEFYDIGDYEVSPDNRILAYSYDDISRRQYHIRFKELSTGKLYDDFIENTGGEIVWANDNKTIFYVVKDPVTLREYRVYRHKLGTPVSEDVLVYQEDDETYTVDISKSKSGDYVFIGLFSTMSSEHRLLEADNPTGEFRIFSERTDNLLYGINHFDDAFYILTNWNALNFRLMYTPADKTSKENWVEKIKHREDTRLMDVEVYRDHLVIHERRNGLNELRVMSHDGKRDTYLKFPEETYALSIGVNMEYDSDILRYNYSSLKVPSGVYDFNMITGETILQKQQEVQGGYDPDAYVTERIWATAKDGKKIPVSLVYRKGLKKDGANPVLLYGYGSYGVTVPDRFSSVRLSLLDRGFIYAIAHIRGGEYLGRNWYEDGKKFNKKNTFTDFISAAEFMVSEGYTSSEKLFAMGGSAGGLLIGAVINMRPDLFKGVLASVPFVDVVTTMLDETIPLTTGEFDEWGNPKEELYYHYMLSYSPYDNVTATDYPNILITTGYWDSQVQYWEPAKWVARLRDKKTDSNLLLMDCNMNYGHGGASGRYETYRETAMEYAFMFFLLGITE